jgi:phosphoglucosamine mutase
MLNNKSALGGEPSGHMIFLDHNTTGDGIVGALQVLRIMMESDSRLSDLASIVKKYPQALVNVKVKEKPELSTLPEVNKAIDEVKVNLGKSGRVLVRYSGTENLCRVMVEGEKLKSVQQHANMIATAIKAQIGA